ncbi:MAG: hypothetical protein COX20_08790 [Desulfobacterales bacterium CG23_combo_of_CG06-09_8_20_14_all_52_9]|nr:MAG: hypothetical protein COX20_08790 [Desulfobacterales bacterium CG23_combo_of_CG06-09_8_20_14_all_52_9]
MKRPRPILKILLWSAVVSVLIALIAAGILTNVTLRSVEKNLPNTLFKQLHDLTLVNEDLAQVVSAAELTKAAPTSENFMRLRNIVMTVHNAVVKLRTTYVFDNLIQSSAFHAVVAPAIADVQLWLSEGVSGYGPETETTVEIVLSRITGAFQKTRAINYASERIARTILAQQRNRLEQFLFSANLLFTLALLITLLMVLLLIRQHLLQRREVQAQAERRRAEEALHRYELLAVHSRDIILFMRRDDGRILEANVAATKSYGYSRDELLKLTIYDLRAPETLELTADQMAEADAGGLLFETVHRCSDGSTFPVEVSSRGETVDGTRTLISVVRDITERKHGEAALRESQERFQELAELLPETIFEMDADGALTFVNKNAFAHFGVSQEDFDRGINGFEIISPEDRPRALENTKRVMGGEKLGLNEYKVLRRDGSSFPVIMHSTAKYRDGKPVGIRGIVIDVTETKKLEAQLRQAHKMEAVGTLAGGIAHDFNNLLQAVQGYAELLLLKRTQGEEGYRELQEIKRAAKRGGDLTRQLLTFSRKVESKLQPVDLNRIVDDVRMLLERTIPKMIRIELHLMGNLHHVNADASQIEQVLMNLAVNARDAMPDGGTLRIETKNIVPDEGYRRTHPEFSPGNYVLLTVTDTGQGMEKTTLEHIFDPFFTTKEVGKGTGLGLAMVYGIVKNHHGHITCVSNPGEGTTFEIFLPGIGQLEGTSRIDTGTAEQRGGSEIILLVDDDTAVRGIGEAILQTFGYTVIGVEDGETALQAYREGSDRIQLVILDLIMPGIGGMECLQIILELNPQAKVIISSGYSVAGQFERISEIGAKAFIHKPYDIQEMLKTVREVLDEGL